MRVLLDEQLPRQLSSLLIGHEVSTVQHEGWAGLINGELLRSATDRGFQVFVTKDQNIEFQQNLKGAGLGILILVAPRHSLEVLRPLLPNLLSAIHSIAPGELKKVTS